MPNQSRPGAMLPNVAPQPGGPGGFAAPRQGGIGPSQPNPWQSQRFGGQPSIPEPIRGPVFRNPFALRSEVPSQISPAQAARVALPLAQQTGGGWQRIDQLAATGNVAAVQQEISRQAGINRSLDGLMSAVNALERANAGAAVVDSYRAQALSLAQQQMRAGVQQPLPWLVTARLALEGQNDALFRETTREILQKFPNNPQAHYFEGVRAVQDQDWRAAEAALRKASDLGMTDESLAQLLKMAIDNQRWIWQYAKVLTAVLIVWLLGLAAIVVTGKYLSRRTLRAILTDGRTDQVSVGPWTTGLYRAVVTLASLYYFISLPVMLALAIALPLALGYAVLMTPFLNLWLVAFVLLGGVGGIVTAISGLRTAFVKVPTTALGRSLGPTEAPQFWQLVRQVASNVGTRPVDDIWVLPGVEMAVLELGSWHQKMRDTGERVLLLGIGLLPGFKIDAMRAVLAHEYAHFVHRDTAGGDVALRVKSAMNRFIEAVVKRGSVRWWDVTVQFLRFYVPLYYRITLGASRLQEVFADRLAVERYGSSSLIEGLHHVVRRDIEFQHLTSKAVSDAIQGTVAPAAFYSPSKAITGHDRLDVETEVRDALQQPTTDLDSHPGMMDRIAFARRVGVDRPLGQGMVISLFGDTVKPLARDMAQQIIDDVKLQARMVKEHDEHMLRQLDRAIEGQPSLELLEARATILYRQGKIEKAIEDLDTILMHCPGDIMTLFSRANVFESQRQYAKAVEDLRRLRTRANELPRDLRHKVTLQLGNCLLRLKQMKAAAASFDEALRLAPNSLNAVLGRLEAALAMKSLGSQREQELLKQAISTWPNMTVFDLLIEAGGLANELAEERERHLSRAPTPGPRAEERVQSSRWLLAGVVGCIALTGCAFLVLLWANTSASDNEVATVAATGAQGTAVSPPRLEESPAPVATTPAIDAEPPAVHSPPATVPPEPAETLVAVPTTDAEKTGKRAVTEKETPTEPEAVGVPSPPEKDEEKSDSVPAVEVAAVEEEPAAEKPEPVKPVSNRIEPARSVPRDQHREKPAEPKLVKIPSVKNRGLRRPKVTEEVEWVESRLRKIALAMHNYQNVNHTFPVKVTPKWFDEENQPLLSWRVHLLPFLDESTLFKQFKLDEPWDSPHNVRLLEYMPGVYRSSPDDDEKTRFVTAIGDHTFFDGNRRSFAHMTDGAVNTILVLQGPADEAQSWTKPTDLLVDMEHPGRAWGRSPRGIFCVMADGSPLHLPGSIPDNVFSALLTARGNESIDGETVRRFAAHRRREMYVAPDIVVRHEMQQLKRIVVALLNYHDTRRQFPGAGPTTDDNPERGAQLSWRVHLLPYLEHRNLYQQFRLDEPWDSPHNKRLAEYMPDVYRDADDAVDSKTTRVLMMTGESTPFVDRRRGPNLRQFTDGAPYTVLAIQAGEESAVVWTKPEDLHFNPRNPLANVGSIDPRTGLLAIMADGSVQSLSPGLDDDTFRILVTPNGGEVVRESDF